MTLGIREEQVDHLMAIRSRTGKTIASMVRDAVQAYIEEFYVSRGEWAKTDSLYSSDAQVQANGNVGAGVRARGASPDKR